MLLEFSPQIVAAVQADIAEQPDAPVERARLRGTLRSRSRAQKREAKTGAGFRGDVRAVGPAKRQPLRHALQQLRVRRRSIERHYAGEAAHDVSELCCGNAESNVA